MRHTLLLLSALLLPCTPLAPLAAYAGFDDILVVEPTWTALPSEPLAAAAGAVYRVRPLGAGRVAVDLRNGGDRPLAVTLRLPGYQSGEGAFELRAAPGATATAEIEVRRADRDCTEGAVRFTRLELGGHELAVRPPPGVLPPSERAFAVSTLWEAAGFRPGVLAYTAVARDTQTIDLHLINRGTQAVHAEFQLPGWQPAGAVNPRLHLLPGTTTEVLVRGVAADERVTAATLTVWAVRVGEDRGDLLGSGPEDHHRLAEVEDDWHPVAAAEEGFAGLNPRTLVFRYADRVLEVRNRAALPVQATLLVPGGTLPPMTVDLAPGATTHLQATAAAIPALVARDVVLAGVALRVAPLAIAPLPANPLTVVAVHDDPLFNPLTIAYAAARQGAGQARITLVNRAAVDLHCDWRLPAYQGTAANPRLHLAAGASTTVVVDVERSDVRLPLAQVAVGNVRLGEDAGALLCVPPAATR